MRLRIVVVALSLTAGAQPAQGAITPASIFSRETLYQYAPVSETGQTVDDSRVINLRDGPCGRRSRRR